MNEIEMSEKVRNDAKKLEIFHQSRDVYTLHAVSASVKQEWAEEIRKIVLSFPKENTNSFDRKIAGKTDKKIFLISCLKYKK